MDSARLRHEGRILPEAALRIIPKSRLQSGCDARLLCPTEFVEVLMRPGDIFSAPTLVRFRNWIVQHIAAAWFGRHQPAWAFTPASDAIRGKRRRRSRRRRG